jgi:hypothetical protein
MVVPAVPAALLVVTISPRLCRLLGYSVVLAGRLNILEDTWDSLGNATRAALWGWEDALGIFSRKWLATRLVEGIRKAS